MDNNDDKVVSLMGMKHNKASRLNKEKKHERYKDNNNNEKGPIYCSFCKRPNT